MIILVIMIEKLGVILREIRKEQNQAVQRSYFFGVCPIFPSKLYLQNVKVCISLVFCECQQLWNILSYFTCLVLC